MSSFVSRQRLSRIALRTATLRGLGALTLVAALAPLAPNAHAAATRPAARCSINAILVPSCGVWVGVAPNPLGRETYDQALMNFEARTGRGTQIAHYYHRGAQLFPTRQEIARATQRGRNRLLLENWKPTTGNTWAAVAAGRNDRVIDAEAAYLRTHFTRRFFLALHGEPERFVIQRRGSGMTAADYRAMFRHVVLRLRARGVRNAITVLDLTGLPTWGSKPWFASLYPGSDVVDWLAEDPYVIGPLHSWYDNDLVSMVNRRFPRYNWPGFYSWASRVAPTKPIMLAEWGVSELRGAGTWKPTKFRLVAAELSRVPRVKALVYWNSNSFNPVGTTRVDSSALSLAWYRRLLAIHVLNQPVPRS